MVKVVQKNLSSFLALLLISLGGALSLASSQDDIKAMNKEKHYKKVYQDDPTMDNLAHWLSAMARKNETTPIGLFGSCWDESKTRTRKESPEQYFSNDLLEIHSYTTFDLLTKYLLNVFFYSRACKDGESVIVEDEITVERMKWFFAMFPPAFYAFFYKNMIWDSSAEKFEKACPEVTEEQQAQYDRLFKGVPYELRDLTSMHHALPTRPQNRSITFWPVFFISGLFSAGALLASFVWSLCVDPFSY